jgi:NADH-quinone oxidoreductase subunit G
MEVITNSERVASIRRGILEFLLLNHPLDCPICDQAGECKLQDYVYQYGSPVSRFEGTKRTYPRIDIGSRLVRNMNRCIHCLRCVRFCREVMGEEIFGSFNRGGKKDVGTYVELPVENNYAGNLVELCPVGALTSRDFRFKARVWKLRPVASICPGCSTGCNVNLWVKDNQILRITPRENPEVNGAWMCDRGRFTHRVMEDGNRLKSPMMREDGKFVPIGWEQAFEEIAGRLKELLERWGAGAVGGLGSSQASNEASYLFARFIRSVIGSPNLDLMDGGRKEESESALDGILLRADPSPNFRGALDMRVAPGDGGLKAQEMFEAVKDGRLRALFVMGADPMGLSHAEGGAVPEALERLELLVVIDPMSTETAKEATFILPSLFCFEDEGTFTNYCGRVQRFSRAVSGPEGCRPDREILRGLSQRMGVDAPYAGPAEVMEEIAREIPAYGSISYGMLGDKGAQL